MKYLNIEETIAYDDDNDKILFLNPEERENSFVLKDTYIWNLFKALLSEEGHECKTKELASKIGDFNSNVDIKILVYRLKKELENKHIPCNLAENENDPKKIKIRGNIGSYTLVLPKIEKKTERILTELYWNHYETLSAQKEGTHKNDEIIAKIGDVYQPPLIQEGGRDCEWDINHSDLYNHNILIEAPNGYGKTTFMRSMILAATYELKKDLSDIDKDKYEAIKKFHKVDGSHLCIYLECKNINFYESGDNTGGRWLYENLSEIESIRINRYISKEDFYDLIKEYNVNEKLILLIDGFDETKAENREKLIKKLNEFQQDADFGCNSKIIISTRPLFWEISFNGYRKYSISNRDIVEDKTVFLKYVKSYSCNSRSINAEHLYDYVQNNYYLRKIACTPAVIVWIIREYKGKGAFYESMERIIEQIMLRYKSRELTVYKEQYKRVYEEFAFHYLCMTDADEGFAYLETEMLSLVRGCIERIEQEGSKRFNRVFADNKTDEELGELFFTNVALMEYINGRIKFSTVIFAYHLAARRILRLFKEEDYSNVCEQLDLIPYQYRYYVMVIAASLVLHLTDIRFFEDYGANADDFRFILAEIFIDYLKIRWTDSSCAEAEKYYLQEAVAHLLLKYYGENVYTNRNIDNKQYISWLEDIMKIQLDECPEAVSQYRREKRQKGII